MWYMKKVIVLPVVLCALGTILTSFERYVATIGLLYFDFSEFLTLSDIYDVAYL